MLLAFGVLVGSLLGAGVTHAVQSEGCTPGYTVSIEGSVGDGEERSFESLAPASQRIFLEAYTGDGVSRRYRSSSTVEELDGTVVEYRGAKYGILVMVVSC